MKCSQLLESDILKVNQLDVELKEISIAINSKQIKLDHKKQLLEQVERKSTVLVEEIKNKK